MKPKCILSTYFPVKTKLKALLLGSSIFLLIQACAPVKVYHDNPSFPIRLKDDAAVEVRLRNDPISFRTIEKADSMIGLKAERVMDESGEEVLRIKDKHYYKSLDTTQYYLYRSEFDKNGNRYQYAFEVPVTCISSITAKERDIITRMYAPKDIDIKLHYIRSFWADAGIGFGGQLAAANFSFNAEILKGKVFTYSKDYTWYEEEAGRNGYKTKSENYLVGFIKKSNAGIMRISTGISLMNVNRHQYMLIGSGCSYGLLGSLACAFGNCPPCTPGPFYSRTVTKNRIIGFPIDGHFLFANKAAGIGINPRININGRFTYVAVTVQISLGILRLTKEALLENE